MHTCDFELEKDGQVRCNICGAMDDDKEPIHETPPAWGDTPVSFEE
jgi:uncharacterized Zn finger protein (UPF0148 family)